MPAKGILHEVHLMWCAVPERLQNFKIGRELGLPVRPERKTKKEKEGETENKREKARECRPKTSFTLRHHWQVLL